MSSKIKSTLIVAGIVVFILVGFQMFRPGQKNDPGSERLDLFAQCLTEQGATMYGTDWCGACQSQKEIFGSSFQYINYVDCDRNRAECQSAGVTGFPTWRINGQSYSGLQQFSNLAQISGCQL